MMMMGNEEISIDKIYDTDAYLVLEEYKEKNNDFNIMDIYGEIECVNLLYPVIKEEIWKQAQEEVLNKLELDIKERFGDFIEDYIRRDWLIWWTKKGYKKDFRESKIDNLKEQIKQLKGDEK